MGLLTKLAEGFKARDKPREDVIQRRMPEDILAASGSLFAGYQMRNNESICAAVTRLANAFATMPIHLYRECALQRDDAMERLIAFEPNASMTPFQMRYAMMASVAVYGRAYALLVPDGLGGVASIDVLNPERVSTYRNADTKEIWYAVTLDNGEQAYVHTSGMLTMLWGSTDGVGFVSPLEVLGATLRYDKAIKEISLKQLTSVSGSVVLTYPANLSNDRRGQMEKQFIDAYSNSHGQVIVLDGGVTADKIAGSVVDPQVLNADTITKSKIASVYNMPVKLLGASTSGDYSTSEQSIKEFSTMTMLPWVEAFEQQLNRKLLRWYRYAQGYRFRFDMTALLRGDTATMAEKHSKLIRAGVMTPNEARAEYDMPPLKYGDELMSARDLIPLRISVDNPEMLLGNSAARTNVEGGEGDEQVLEPEQ